MVEDIDPLSAAYSPPVDETPAERAKREAEEVAAKKVSDEIDQMLKDEAKQKKIKSKKEVKVLLLGQSESGKSTCLKQFQLLYAPTSFAAERQAWKAVIYLNLVKSVRRILDSLTHQDDDAMSDDSYGSGQRPETPMSLDALASPQSEFSNRQSTDDNYSQFAAIKLRLSPLTLAEDLLVRQLAGDGEDEATQLGNYHLNGKNGTSVGNKVKEVFVRSGNNWKKAFSGSNRQKDNDSTTSSSDSGHNSLKDDPFKLVAACADDMAALWTDRTVRQILERKKVRLQESSGFYLDDIQRITARDYVPSTQDVLNARLKTVGVIEHHFALDKGGEKGVDWKIYDVGGHRSQRQTWAPFFDDVQAIIFLAPIR
ncbi:hypothetical protein FRC03_010409 [Tulasnella sp. 419]|nr:hypothetical protein FRC03_010409 [Tulasnella sp. 419]